MSFIGLASQSMILLFTSFLSPFYLGDVSYILDIRLHIWSFFTMHQSCCLLYYLHILMKPALSFSRISFLSTVCFPEACQNNDYPPIFKGSTRVHFIQV